MQLTPIPVAVLFAWYDWVPPCTSATEAVVGYRSQPAGYSPPGASAGVLGLGSVQSVGRPTRTLRTFIHRSHSVLATCWCVDFVLVAGQMLMVRLLAGSRLWELILTLSAECLGTNSLRDSDVFMWYGPGARLLLMLDFELWERLAVP